MGASKSVSSKSLSCTTTTGTSGTATSTATTTSAASASVASSGRKALKSLKKYHLDDRIEKVAIYARPIGDISESNLAWFQHKVGEKLLGEKICHLALVLDINQQATQILIERVDTGINVMLKSRHEMEAELQVFQYFPHVPDDDDDADEHGTVAKDTSVPVAAETKPTKDIQGVMKEKRKAMAAAAAATTAAYETVADCGK